MSPATHNIFRIAKKRGIWLRCFLDKLSQAANAARGHCPGVLKGHDFSRAVNDLNEIAALAAEGRF